MSDAFLASRFPDIEEELLEEPEIHTPMSGPHVKITKGVWFTWHTLKNRISRQSFFRVAHGGPFDIIIGATLLFSEGIYLFNEAALLFFHRKPRPGECKAIHLC